MERISAKKLQIAGVTDRSAAHKQLFGLYDELLDQRYGDNWLHDPRIASVIRSNLYHHHESKYALQAYCVMPNHVHVLLESLEIGETTDEMSPLANIMHSLKSYTAHEANRILRRQGTFWQSESYDHWVRDEFELERIIDYIANNPVKAGFVKNPHDWFFCSSHDRFLMDGEICGWLRWP
jgi:REP-associated tyrosine transposase